MHRRQLDGSLTSKGMPSWAQPPQIKYTSIHLGSVIQFWVWLQSPDLHAVNNMLHALNSMKLQTSVIWIAFKWTELNSSKWYQSVHSYHIFEFSSLIFASFAFMSLSNMGGSRGIGSRHRSWAALFTCRHMKIWVTGKHNTEQLHTSAVLTGLRQN